MWGFFFETSLSQERIKYNQLDLSVEVQRVVFCIFSFTEP